MLKDDPLMDVARPHVNEREWVVYRQVAMAHWGRGADCRLLVAAHSLPACCCSKGRSSRYLVIYDWSSRWREARAVKKSSFRMRLSEDRSPDLAASAARSNEPICSKPLKLVANLKIAGRSCSSGKSERFTSLAPLMQHPVCRRLRMSAGGQSPPDRNG